MLPLSEYVSIPCDEKADNPSVNLNEILDPPFFVVVAFIKCRKNDPWKQKQHPNSIKIELLVPVSLFRSMYPTWIRIIYIVEYKNKQTIRYVLFQM